MPKGLLGFSKEAEGQAAFFAGHGVPGHAALLRAMVTLLDEDPAVRVAVEGTWEERDFQPPYERPLLVCAAVHRDVLCDPSHPMAAALAGGEPVDARALARLLTPPSPVLDAMRSRFVQTNEVTRAVVWRLTMPPSWLAEPCALADLGCSAGLNLVADRLNLSWHTEQGEPLALGHPRHIVARVGLDRAPVDPSNAEQALWLRACLWPGQTERRARLDAAIAEATQAHARGELVRIAVDAVDMPGQLETMADRVAPARMLAYQSIFAGYLPPEVRARYEEGMRAWLAHHEGRALWAELETAPRGEGGVHPAQIRVTFAEGRGWRTLVVASCDYHPRAVTVDPARLAEVYAATKPDR